MWALVQFFKAEAAGRAAGSPRTKDEDDAFVLQNAELAGLAGAKERQGDLRANRAAVRAFGSGIEKEDGTLAAIWSPLNQGIRPAISLAAAARGAGPPVFQPQERFAGRLFWRSSCLTASDDIGLLQLVKEAPAGILAGGRVQHGAAAATPDSAAARGGAGLCHAARGGGGGSERGAQAEAGLRAATGSLGGAGLQQRADQHFGACVVAV
jgi:hypothetical protein